MELISQGFIAIFGLVAMYLLYSDKPNHKYHASWIGLCGQPFWLYSTIVAGQIGMILVTLGFTALYIRGIIKFK